MSAYSVPDMVAGAFDERPNILMPVRFLSLSNCKLHSNLCYHRFLNRLIFRTFAYQLYPCRIRCQSLAVFSCRYFERLAKVNRLGVAPLGVVRKLVLARRLGEAEQQATRNLTMGSWVHLFLFLQDAYLQIQSHPY
jgi:hypothetical protein